MGLSAVWFTGTRYITFWYIMWSMVGILLFRSCLRQSYDKPKNGNSMRTRATIVVRSSLLGDQRGGLTLRSCVGAWFGGLRDTYIICLSLV